jgi:hypothetical protein
MFLDAKRRIVWENEHNFKLVLNFGILMMMQKTHNLGKGTKLQIDVEFCCFDDDILSIDTWWGIQDKN